MAERIQSLDVLRGLAILGILAVNAPFFAGPWQGAINPTLPPMHVTPETLWAWFIPHVFFEAKFITLFSLLFGVSLFLVGGERSDAEKGANLRRRLAWMVLFGVIHGALIWFGDILLVYALTGFLVLFARSWSPRMLLIVGAVIYAVVMGAVVGFGLLLPLAPPEQLALQQDIAWSPSQDFIARQIADYQAGGLSSTISNFAVWLNFAPVEIIGTVPRVAGLMMIGLALYKWGFMSAQAPAWLYWTFAAIGAAALAVIFRQAQINAALNFDFLHMQSRGTIPNQLLCIFVTLGYASLVLLTVKANALTFITGPLAAAGRMAFSNYIAQSLIMTTIFYGGRGLAQYGEWDRAQIITIVPAIWLLQLAWSPLWLRYFEMGPLEWIWRRLTYARPVPFRRRAPA